jgi:hypothetical protein
MAWPDFSMTDLYNGASGILTKLNTGFTRIGKLFKDQATGDFVDQVRWSSANKRLEAWSGSAWVALDMSGTAAASDGHSAAATGAEHGAVSTNSANMIVRRNASGGFSAGTITADLTGTASKVGTVFTRTEYGIAVGAHSGVTMTQPAAGATVGDLVLISVSASSWPETLLFSARVISAGNIQINVRNTSAGTVSIPDTTYYMRVISKS